MANRKFSAENKQVWQICITFGLTIGISIYILGFLIGAYLDKKFATAPLFTIIGALLAIASSFARLIKGFSTLDKKNSGNEKKSKQESR